MKLDKCGLVLNINFLCTQEKRFKIKDKIGLCTL